MPKRKHGASAAGPSQRQLRAAELVRHALVGVLARDELRDPALIGALITIGEVRASPDLRHMHVFVAPLGGGDPAPLAAALNRAAPFLRGRLAREVDLRNAPALHFLADTSYAIAQRIDAALAAPDVARDLLPPAEESP
jgi:ribosome-binding factor A